VKANQGATGVDKKSIEDFEANLSGNLCKLWNRMSSGRAIFGAGAARRYSKASVGIRPLGIPTVANHIVQEVVRRSLADLGAGVSSGVLTLPAQANLRLMPSRKLASVVGATTGCSIST
jgi:hypothetical protein